MGFKQKAHFQPFYGKVTSMKYWSVQVIDSLTM